MKKLVVGIVIGAALAFSSQAVAETISNIGKTVDAEYPVVVDGKMLDTKAIAVDGVSNTPNRALADAIGYAISFKDETVYFDKRVEKLETDGDTVSEQPTIIDPVDPIVLLEPVGSTQVNGFTLENIDGAIQGQQGAISTAKVLQKADKPENNNAWLARIAELEAELERLQGIKAELEAHQ